MKLYNTLSKKVEEFAPLEDNSVKLYTCGLTVYSHPHIGNWVAYIYWDVLVRALKAHGYSVEHVQNITDVGHLTSDGDAGEDKMTKGALKEGLSAWEVADKYITIADREATKLLGLLPPTYKPRATEYIQQQIDFIKALEEKGYTYVIADGVYFDTSKLEHYGALAQLDVKGLRFGARVEDTGKRNPTDFAVWKLSDPSEKRDMEWESPWGTGFPGWHLECSVMARELLGDQIDIHTGGVDHIPVHHTNEIAQTEAITGKQFSQFWIHANHIKVDGTKMSKSLGNIYTLQDVIDKGYDCMAFKLVVLSKHYRTEGNFTWKIVAAAQNRLNHWQAVADLRWQAVSTDDKTPPILDHVTAQQQHIQQTSKDILKSLENDLDTPRVLAVIDELFNILEPVGIHAENQSDFDTLLSQIAQLLGVNLLKPDITTAQKELFARRGDARDASDWAVADQLRNKLREQGLEIRDTSNGQLWSRI